MKKEINELLEEMIAYSEDPGQDIKWNYLKKAIDLMGDKEGFYHFLTKLLNWLDPVLLKLSGLNSEKLKLRGSEGIDYGSYIIGMSNFFECCPELNQIFELKDEVIYFNSSLSNKEQEYIREFVDAKSKRKVTNFYIRPENDNLDK